MFNQSLLNSNNIEVISSLGNMQVIQYTKDLSVSPYVAKTEYYSAKMNVNRRQLLINLNGDGYTIQAGAMQWTAGNVEMNSGVKGAGDFLGKMVASKVTKESAVKPNYFGNGQLMLEPTYRHILLTNVADWGGQVVLDDGLFLACQNSIQQKVIARSNVSSALLGGEGLFNLSLIGNGVVALESIVPREELFEIELQNDVLKIDGNMAIAWSGSLEFTVEKSSKSLIGSAVSGEGLVNVYRGSGKVWMAPVTKSYLGAGLASPTQNAQSSQTGSVASKAGTAGNVIEAAGNVADLLGKFL